jgi:hypothetical protein
VDGYLTNKAQGHFPTALVICTYPEAGGQVWLLRRAGEEDVGLGNSFGGARVALNAWMRAERRAEKQKS